MSRHRIVLGRIFPDVHQTRHTAETGSSCPYLVALPQSDPPSSRCYACSTAYLVGDLSSYLPVPVYWALVVYGREYALNPVCVQHTSQTGRICVFACVLADALASMSAGQVTKPSRRQATESS
jgi:hypothetical protein